MLMSLPLSVGKNKVKKDLAWAVSCDNIDTVQQKATGDMAYKPTATHAKQMHKKKGQ